MSALALALAALCAGQPSWAEGTATASKPVERSIRVAGDRAFPPFEYLDEAGQPAGFDIDLVNALARTMGLKVEVELTSWREARQRFDRGDADLMSGIFKSASRQDSMDFAVPHFISVYRIFALEGAACKDVDVLGDLRGKRIAVQDGDLGHEYLVAAGYGSSLVIVEDAVHLFTALEDGLADRALSSTSHGWRATENGAFTSIEAIGEPLFSAEYCMAVRKGDTELLAAINEGLSILRADGTYDRLYRRWFGDYGEYSDTRSSGIVAAIVTIAATLVAAALLWIVATRSAVRRKTAELAWELEREAEIQKRLQEALVAAEEARLAAERADQERVAFVSWISRELRTPLQGMLGSTELLQKAHLDDEQARTLDMARTSAEMLTRVLSDLLDAMGTDKGSMRLEPVEFSFEEFATRMESTIRPLAEDNGLAFRFSMSGRDTRIVADINRITRIVMNLCDNAIAYTDRGEVELVLGFNDDGLYISVKDTGSGIPAEARERLFRPQYCSKRGGRNGAGGLGLGLTIVRAIVDAMGGSIRYETHPSMGTHFEVSLPVASATPAGETAGEPVSGQPAPAKVAATAPPERRGGKAIVAEDEAINRLYLKRVLEGAGYEVTAAADGEAALDAASDGTWDFILMDVSMPRMDGLEATRRIRGLEAERGSPRVPIIALTAHAYAEDREACSHAGMDGFLSKPFTEPALWTEVRRIVGKGA